MALCGCFVGMEKKLYATGVGAVIVFERSIGSFLARACVEEACSDPSWACFLRFMYGLGFRI